MTEVDHVLSLPATNLRATFVETNTYAAESEKKPKAQLDGTWCTECKGKIHRGARRLKCSQFKSPFHIQCMTTMRIQANVYLQTPTWRCPRCRPQGDQKDTDDDTKPKLDKTSAGIFKSQISILQWNANAIYRESQLLDDSREDVIAIQETRLLPRDKTPTLTNYHPVCRDRPVQGEARGGGLLTCVKKSLPYKVCRPFNNEEGALERLSIQIPISNQQTVTISNWYLPSENSHFLQRIGFSMSVFQPEIQENEIICADLNAHNEIWDKHAHSDDRGAQLTEAIMDAKRGFLNDDAKIQLSAASLLQMSPLSAMASTTTVTGHRWILFYPTTGQTWGLSTSRHNNGRHQNDWCGTERRATSWHTQQTLKSDYTKNHLTRMHPSPLHMNHFAPPSLPPQNLTSVSKP